MNSEKEFTEKRESENVVVRDITVPIRNCLVAIFFGILIFGIISAWEGESKGIKQACSIWYFDKAETGVLSEFEEADVLSENQGMILTDKIDYKDLDISKKYKISCDVIKNGKRVKTITTEHT